MEHTLWLVTGLLIIAASAMDADSGRLVQLSYVNEKVQGKYASKDKTYGITFVSRSDDYLLIRTFSGKTLVETSPITETDGHNSRSIYILGHEYTQHESSAHSDRPVDHEKPLSDAIHELLGIREINLLMSAAEAVGKKGLNGESTPAVLPFFNFALRVTQLAEDSQYNNTTHRYKRESYMHCASTCPPCPNDECIGLCGKDCRCLKWICNDCCWHRGCYDHDLCCKKSWLQTGCLLPFKFRCDQPYKCR